jgi:hypothetical protein
MSGPSAGDTILEMGPGTSLANCVKSDAKRRQSRSSFCSCSDFDIVHHLESSARKRRMGACVLSVAYATHENKKLRDDPKTCGDKPAVDAAGTAAAIATSPFRGSYAYDNGHGYDNGYARRNGFVCQPGTWFRGEDGRRHLCQ